MPKITTHDIQLNIDTLPDKVRNEIIRYKDLCIANDIKLILSKDRRVELSSGEYCNGYFCDQEREFAVSCGQPYHDWLIIFLHESSHMDQWLEQIPEWLILNKGYDDLPFKEMTDEQQISHTTRYRDIELDCERRTAQKIVELDIDIGITVEEYIQKCNAYVWFYNIVLLTGKWYTIGKEPYNVEEIWRAMPTHFDNDYTITPQHVKELMIKYAHA